MSCDLILDLSNHELGAAGPFYRSRYRQRQPSRAVTNSSKPRSHLSKIGQLPAARTLLDLASALSRFGASGRKTPSTYAAETWSGWAGDKLSVGTAMSERATAMKASKNPMRSSSANPPFLVHLYLLLP